MSVNKKILFISLLCIAVLAIIFFVFIWYGNNALKLTKYTVSSEKLPIAFDGFKIAQISDFHNAEMGKDNGRLISLLKEAKPDIIAITGDMIDSRNTRVAVALEFAEEALKIAPCYYVSGNHEGRTNEYIELKAGLDELGVTVLAEACVEIEISGERINLLGVNDISFDDMYNLGYTYEILHKKLALIPIEKEKFNILLSHRPEFYYNYVEYGADLVLCGHAHGGQIRLPFVGGILAPGQGLFPEFDSGVFTQDGTSMVVSRGIGNSLFPFRVNNNPEVVLVELKAS